MKPTMVVPRTDRRSLAGNVGSVTLRSPSWRRWLACLCLALAWALANWGAMVLQSVLSGWWFDAWWILCGTLAFTSVSLATLEVAASWRWMREDQRRCIERQEAEIARQENPRASDPD